MTSHIHGRPFQGAAIKGAIACCMLLATAACAAAANAPEICLPPACPQPTAISWPDPFGSSWGEKALMAATLPAAWLIVWGFFLLVGFNPQRPMPALLRANPEMAKAWIEQQKLARQEWELIAKDPEKMAASRRAGAAMLASGLALGALLAMSDPAGVDYSGSRLAAARWDASSNAFEKKLSLRLDPGRKACEDAPGPCKPWGRWSSNGAILILTPEPSSKEPYSRYVSDGSGVRFWKKAETGSDIVEFVQIELPDSRSSFKKGFD